MPSPPRESNEPRFEYSKPPEFTEEIGYPQVVGAKKGDGGMLTYWAVASAAVLALLCLTGIALFVWLP